MSRNQEGGGQQVQRDGMSERQRNGCRAVARAERSREAESAEQRRAQEDAAYMRMVTAAVAFLGIVEAADWLLRALI